MVLLPSQFLPQPVAGQQPITVPHPELAGGSSSGIQPTKFVIIRNTQRTIVLKPIASPCCKDFGFIKIIYQKIINQTLNLKCRVFGISVYQEVGIYNRNKLF